VAAFVPICPAAVANLVQRFAVPESQVVDALQQAKGHAGRAAAKLRESIEVQRRHGRSSPLRATVVPKLKLKLVPVARQEAPPARSEGPARGGALEPEPEPAPFSPANHWTTGAGPKVAIALCGGDSSGRVLVRRVRELCSNDFCAVHEAADRIGTKYALKHTEREVAGRRRWQESQREAESHEAVGQVRQRALALLGRKCTRFSMPSQLFVPRRSTLSSW
jgi:hypothetical protein